MDADYDEQFDYDSPEARFAQWSFQVAIRQHEQRMADWRALPAEQQAATLRDAGLTEAGQAIQQREVEREDRRAA